jgi:hypothetical protein
MIIFLGIFRDKCYERSPLAQLQLAPGQLRVTVGEKINEKLID